jgi:hypothetical protein
MELDDLKNTWDDINSRVKTQQHLNTEKINQMIKSKYYSKLKRIAYPEIVGVIICVAAAVYIVLHFSKLNTVFLQGTGIVSILLLLLQPALSLLSLSQFSITGAVTKTYTETLKDFAVKKLRFYKLQKMNVTLSYLLLVTTIVLISKFFNGKDITNSKYFWIFSFSLGYIFLLFYSKWVTRYYKKTLRQAEDLLKELGD